ncbi:MAG TPA: hypothetical protein VKX96_07530 [Chloroflexota bacterium]|nr:hypothetical protein [Chloroflexota bacterium]
MKWSRLANRASDYLHRVNDRVHGFAWWMAVGPFCIATDLPMLTVSGGRPLRLSGEPNPYPSTELLGRLLAFEGQVRFARSLLILFRAVLICGVLLVISRALEIATHWMTSPWLPLIFFLVIGWAIHLSLHHSISTFEVARLIDKRMGLQAQVATAVEIAWQHRQLDSLSQAQARLATSRLRECEPHQTFPLVFPGKDVRAFVGVVAVYLVLSVIGTLALNVPRPQQAIDVELAKQVRQDAQAPSPFVSMDASAAQIQTLSPSPANDAVGQQLDQLDQELKSQAITPAEYQAQLQSLQQQIQSQANQSLAAQEALQRLAQALNDSSTTQPISDSLTQGNYQQAAAQLSDLAKQVGNLSPQAQAQLAQQMSQASQQTQGLNQSISQNAAQTAEALRQGQSGQAQQSLQQLAQAVNNANQQIASQSQLGQDMQQVQQRLGSQTAGQPTQNASSASAQGNGQTSADAQGDQNTGSDQMSASDQASAQGQNADSQNQSGGATSGASVSTSSQGQEQGNQSNGAGAGSGPGSNLFGGAPTPLDVNAKKLTILGQASDNGSSDTTSAGDRSNPLTGATDSSIGVTGGNAPTASNAPVNVHQESNVVPLDLKPVVREYFSHAGP